MLTTRLSAATTLARNLLSSYCNRVRHARCHAGRDPVAARRCQHIATSSPTGGFADSAAGSPLASLHEADGARQAAQFAGRCGPVVDRLKPAPRSHGPPDRSTDAADPCQTRARRPWISGVFRMRAWPTSAPSRPRNCRSACIARKTPACEPDERPWWRVCWPRCRHCRWIWKPPGRMRNCGPAAQC